MTIFLRHRPYLKRYSLADKYSPLDIKEGTSLNDEKELVDEKEVIIEDLDIQSCSKINCGNPSCTAQANCCCTTDQVTFAPCQDFQDFTVIGNRETNEGVELQCQARLLKIRVCFKNICKGRKLAIGVMLCDPVTFKVLGFKGREVTVPNTGPAGACCPAFTVSDFCFVLPDTNLCNPKTVLVKVISHYTDFNPPTGCPC